MAVQATAVWRCRPSGANTNGGGYDPGISGAATDYSQQNAAQATGTHGSAVSTTTFTDLTAANFTSAMVGNCINIAGQGFYFIVTFTDASHVVVDRALGTFTLASWSLGGGWADPWTNTTSSGPLVPGNIVYILGSGTPNPASYVFDYTATGVSTPAFGDAVNGSIIFANDPSTPGYKAPPDTTGGMPTLKSVSTSCIIFSFFQACSFQGLWMVANSATNGNSGIVRTNSSGPGVVLTGCVIDQNGFDVCAIQGNGQIQIIGCEIFSSVAPGGGGSNAAISSVNYQFHIFGCNIHDTVGQGVFSQGSGAASGDTVHIENSIIAKCRGNGVEVLWDGDNISLATIQQNTIDGNTGHGVLFDTTAGIGQARVVNNIISNHTGGGKFGLSIGAGTAAANTRVAGFVDYNVFYNNTANYNAISAGPHDTALGSDPYVAQSTEDYDLK